LAQCPNSWWEIPPADPVETRLHGGFGAKPQLARLLYLSLHRAAFVAARGKGSFKMFARGNIQRQIAVFAVALLMSTIAVGAAVAPGTAAAAPFTAVTYA
jgi:hypothetical protein